MVNEQRPSNKWHAQGILLDSLRRQANCLKHAFGYCFRHSDSDIIVYSRKIHGVTKKLCSVCVAAVEKP